MLTAVLRVTMTAAFLIAKFAEELAAISKRLEKKSSVESFGVGGRVNVKRA